MLTPSRLDPSPDPDTLEEMASRPIFPDEPELLDSALRALAVASAALARYCDHAEHVERADRAAASSCAHEFIGWASRLAAGAAVDLIGAYASRLDSIEAANVLHHRGDFAGGAAARAAGHWPALQEVQIEHDRRYHPDVFGLARIEQLRHCALHCSKLVGAIARRLDDPGYRYDFETRRLPDLLLFGIKIATLMGERLPDIALTRIPIPDSASSAVLSPSR